MSRAPGPDPKASAALLQMGAPMVPMPPWHVERLAPEPREHAPIPTCHEGGPHCYPPGRESVCEDCGRGPTENALSGLRRAEAEAKLHEAFA